MTKRLFLISLAAILLSGCLGGGTGNGGGSMAARGLVSGAAHEAGQAAAQLQVLSAAPGSVAVFDGRAAQISGGMSVPDYAIIRAGAGGPTQIALGGGKMLNIPAGSEVDLSEFGQTASIGGNPAAASSARPSHSFSARGVSLGVRGLH